MELNDALRRIVGQHWRLLTACMLAGLALGLLFAPHAKEYLASARLVLDTPDPVARAQSDAISDTGKALATAPAEVSGALRKAGVNRGDPADFAKTHVSLRALGSSGVLELSVTDRDRKAAASVANALASLVIRTRLEVTNGESTRVLATLDRRTEALSRKIAATQDYVNALSVEIAGTRKPQDANALRGKRDAAQRSVDFLIQQRGVLESERVSLLSASAQRPRPSIISAATPATTPQPTHRTMYLVLGAVLGLILGMGIAGVLETVRPTLVGGDAVASELDAPLLGGLGSGAALAGANNVGARLRLAAEAADVRNIAVVGAGVGVDLERVVASLGSSAAADSMLGNGNGGALADAHGQPLRIAPFEPQSPPFNNGSRSGLVLVAPGALKKTDLTDVGHLLRASNLPLLGLITYGSPPRGALARLKRAVTQ